MGVSGFKWLSQILSYITSSPVLTLHEDLPERNWTIVDF